MWKQSGPTRLHERSRDDQRQLLTILQTPSRFRVLRIATLRDDEATCQFCSCVVGHISLESRLWFFISHRHVAKNFGMEDHPIKTARTKTQTSPRPNSHSIQHCRWRTTAHMANAFDSCNARQTVMLCSYAHVRHFGSPLYSLSCPRSAPFLLFSHPGLYHTMAAS